MCGRVCSNFSELVQLHTVARLREREREEQKEKEKGKKGVFFYGMNSQFQETFHDNVQYLK